MSDSPSDKPNNVLPLLRIGLEEGDPEATLRIEQPKPATGTQPRTGAARRWEPPSVEELQHALPQYEVQAFIARGGMGAVYRGVQRTLGRTVAIKILPPDADDDDEVNFAERFKREARAMASLSHPGIVAVHDAGEVVLGDGRALAPASAASDPSRRMEDHPPHQNGGLGTTRPTLLYFVMEYIEGTDVAQLIASEGRVEPARALAITAHVCDALAFAHESGIVHRDIKPSNIMIDRRGRVKVADFGLAKTTTQESRGLTLSGMAMGTPDFVAPETLVAGTKVDQRADIYAVGVMLYQMLTGEIPRGRFELPSQMLPQLDARLDAVIDKAMQRDREKRYSSALDLRADLDAVTATPMAMPSTLNLGASPGSAGLRPAHPSPPPSGANEMSHLEGGAPKSGKLRAVWKTALPVALVLTVVAFLVFKQQGQDNPTPRGGIPAGDGTASTTPPGYAWQRVFQEKEKDGWILLNEETLRAPAITDGAVRLELAGNSGYCALQLREKLEIGAYQASFGSNVMGLRLRHPSSVEKEVELAQYPLPPRNSSGTDRFEFRALGTTLTVLWNDVVVGTVEHDAIKVGGVGIYGRNARVRNVEVLRPDAAGRAASPKPSSATGALGQSAPPKPDPRYPVGQWVRPFQKAADINQKWFDAGAKWENGWITPGGGFNQGIVLAAPNAQGRNWGARAKARWGGGSVNIVLRRSGSASSNTMSAYQFRISKSGAEFQRSQGRASVSGSDLKLLGSPSPIALTEGQEVLIEAFAIGDSLHGRVEGKVFTMKTDGVLKEGGFEVGTQIMPCRDIEFINLDGLTEAEARKAVGLE